MNIPGPELGVVLGIGGIIPTSSAVLAGRGVGAGAWQVLLLDSSSTLATSTLHVQARTWVVAVRGVEGEAAEVRGGRAAA